MASPSSKNERNDEVPDWRELVLVCSKCQRKRNRPAFRHALRKALKSAGHGGRFRVVETSCLAICSKDGISVVRGRNLADDPPRVHIIGPTQAAEDLVDWLLD